VGTRAAKIDLLDVTNSTFTCNGSGCDSITLLRSEFKGQPMPEITELLQAWSNGNDAALETLIAQVDPELRQIAHKYMLNERPEHLLQTTALVNEALLKLIPENITWGNRKHFYSFVARRMRQVLVDYARKARRAEYVDVDLALIPVERPKEILLLDEALNKFAEIQPRAAAVVECRHYIGLTVKEVAELLGLGESTVERDWKFAQGWLKREMTKSR
jgi:RNA polymerase sigma factor (TIGR02999 family)